jgi:hypothetical protein
VSAHYDIGFVTVHYDTGFSTVHYDIGFVTVRYDTGFVVVDKLIDGNLNGKALVDRKLKEYVVVNNDYNFVDIDNNIEYYMYYHILIFHFGKYVYLYYTCLDYDFDYYFDYDSLHIFSFYFW